MIVQTVHGSVRGELRGNVMVFRGIPYGEAQRFLPPQPAKAWQGVRDCTKNGPIAVQNGHSISGDAGLGPYFSGGHPEDFGVADEPMGEDCLVLNVLAPVQQTEKKPVLVYIHGGGFATGSGTLVIGAHRFVQEQDVVLVGVNHRLNVLGYLYLEHLDEKYAGSGVAGMLDLVLALEWVRDNIAAFGGDPEKVTIMGESGGGMKVSTLLAMPEAAGLFHQAIVESGSAPVGALLPQQAAENTRKVLEQLGLREEECTALETLSARKLVQAAEDAGVRLEPVADGMHLAPNPEGTYLAPEIARGVPLMVGSSLEEMAVFTPREQLEQITRENLVQKLMEHSVRWSGGAQDCTAGTMQRRIEAVGGAEPVCDDAVRIYLRIVSLGSVLGGGAFHQAAAKTRQGGAPVYHYVVNYGSPLPGMEQLRCAWHTADLPLQLRLVLYPESDTLSRRMAAAVGAFVRSGDPSVPELAWPAFEEEKRLTMVYDEVCHVESDPWRAMREALE